MSAKSLMFLTSALVTAGFVLEPLAATPPGCTKVAHGERP